MLNRKIQNVTFPRSGHELLMRLLKDYFQQDFHLCRIHGHCQTVPCIDPETNYQKNHDFDLSLNNIPTSYYLIQYRHPFESLISHYEFLLMRGKIVEDSEKNWLIFSKKAILYWKNFVGKWVINNDNPNTHYTSYLRLVSEPEIELRKAIRFINPEKQMDEELVSTILKNTNIVNTRKVEQFKFYNKVYFGMLKFAVRHELKRLKPNI